MYKRFAVIKQCGINNVVLLVNRLGYAAESIAIVNAIMINPCKYDNGNVHNVCVWRRYVTSMRGVWIVVVVIEQININDLLMCCVLYVDIVL